MRYEGDNADDVREVAAAAAADPWLALGPHRLRHHPRRALLGWEKTSECKGDLEVILQSLLIGSAWNDFCFSDTTTFMSTELIVLYVLSPVMIERKSRSAIAEAQG